MHPFYDMQQLKMLLRVGLHIFILFIVLNIGMWIATGFVSHLFWVPKQFFGIDFVKENYEKTQGAIDYYHDNKIDPQTSLAVILGLSSASEGISIGALQQTSALGYNVLSLSGAGRNFSEIELYSRSLLNSSLKPGLVVFAINPFHLMDAVDAQDTPETLIQKHSTWQLLTGWFSEKRSDIRHQLDMGLLILRTNLFRVFENRISGHNLAPWRDNTVMDIQALSSPQQWQSKLNEYGARGYYNIENYRHSGKQVEIFAGIIRSFEQKGSQVIIVLMPEHTLLFSSVPEGAFEVLVSALTSQLQGASLPEIVNLQQLIPDGGFNDISHMNEKGRKIFSHQLDGLIVSHIEKLPPK